MKAIITCMFSVLILLSEHSSAQEIDSDVRKIHLEVYRLMKGFNGKPVVAPKTSKNIFQTFNVNEPLGLGIDPKGVWNKAEWKTFISEVDTAAFADYELGSGGVGWFKKPGNMLKNYVHIVFAPVIMSEDHVLALSLVTRFAKTSNSGSYLSVYLAKEHGRWRVKGLQTLGFID